MRTNTQQGLKPFICKAIIILMSLTYVLGPMHVEVGKFLESVRDVFEAPEYVISHKKKSHKNEKIDFHKVENHTKNQKREKSKVIAFIQKILKETNKSNENSDSRIVHHKIDKHINNYQYILYEENIVLLPKVEHQFSENIQAVSKGYLKGFKEPPKSSFHFFV